MRISFKWLLAVGAFVFLSILLFLFFHLTKIRAKMEEVSSSANDLAGASLIMDVPFQQELPVKQGMLVEDQLKAKVQFNLSEKIHVQDSVRVKRRLQIPVKIDVIDTIDLKNHAIRISDSTLIYVLKDTIPIEQNIHILWPGFKKKNIPISAKIPVDQTLYIRMDDEMTTSARIPIQIPVETTVEYDLDMMIPIEMDIPVNLPIREQLAIHLEEPIQVNTRIPVNTVVPVNVRLKETELYDPLKAMSQKLKELSELIWPF